jgi:2-polyprenyl-6-methoxyphenol hydroxylase-like FAD-dependent oxidoreductase
MEVMMSAKRFEHAVVLGSGIAGLVTSRVLADYFDRVTLLERDAAPPDAGSRPGVPQGRHFHGLLPGGLLILAELFPGFPEELVAAGSLLPGPDEFYFFRPEGKSYAIGAYKPTPRPDDGQRFVYVQSRGLLEQCVRSRVAALDNVELCYAARVEDITAEDGRVTGVKVAHAAEPISADLVIDAMGRGGKTLQWLDRLGFERPLQDVVNCDFAYTSVLMQPRTPEIFTDVGFFVMSSPSMRGGGLVRQEHGVWLASVGGRHGDYPPRDLPGFMAYAESTGEPLFRELLAQADAVSEPASYRFEQSVRRRFEQLERFPDGLLPIGDAVCHYNPLYGQGMSAACRQAMVLRRILEQRAGEGLDGLWRAFLPAAYQETRAPWLFAALADFRDPRCTGDFPAEEGELINLLAYVVRQAAAGDLDALGTTMAIQGLVAPLESLRQPPWPERLAAASAPASTA